MPDETAPTQGVSTAASGEVWTDVPDEAPSYQDAYDWEKVIPLVTAPPHDRTGTATSRQEPR